VHFLRFELSPGMVVALKAGSALSIGIQQDHYRALVAPVAAELRSALLADLA
jgi:hypothetical protein